MAASTTLTPEQRILRARIAANTRWANEKDRRASGIRGQLGLLEKFAREVDPDGELPEEERLKRAQAARRAHMQRLQFASSRKRSSSRPADTGGAAA